MRLAVVTPEYEGVTAYTGGIGSQYAMLAPELVRQGHEVEVVTLSPDARRTCELDGVSFSLVGQPRQATLRPPAWTYASHAALTALGAVDVVLACEYGGGGWRFAVGPRSSPLVTHLHSSTIQIARTSEWLVRQRLLPTVVIQRILERQQARKSDALLAPTRSILEWSRELWRLPDLPAEVVPNMIDVARVRALGETGLPARFPAGGPVVAYSGRLEARKGVHVLVRAMRQVWEHIPEARLVLLGADNPYRGLSMASHLRDLAGTHVSRLHILGHRPPERLFPTLRAADVVALPSLWENFATAALEAMALGSAMVVTRGTGFDEFLHPDREAVMVARGDASELSVALLRLLDDAQLRSRLSTAAAVSARAFDVAPVALRTAAALTSVTRGSA
jgi:glycogen synthase